MQPKAKSGKSKQGAAADDGASPVKKGKKQKAAQANPQGNAQSDPALAPEAVAKQLMLNFLGN